MITTWNLQGVSTRDRNRNRLKRVVAHAKERNWEIVLISEIRAADEGVIWLGEDETRAAVIHSKRGGVILQGDALKSWIEGNQQKSPNERVTAVQINNLRLISVYQPLWSYGLSKLEDFRRDFENEIARTPEESTLVIGGDFNSHMGRNSERPGVSGMYGISTNTMEAGEDLVNWCETLNLQLLNTFYPIKKRGTWFNHSHRRASFIVVPT